jgi:NDP-sugar pyrophosphorylase family protein
MAKKRTLGIMAAGLGTRFGSLKQLYALNANNYAILDYSIFDAISVGFNTIIIIVSNHTLETFKARYYNKLPANINLECVVQQSTELDLKYPERQKPFGTGHALVMLKNSIKDNFALINADDFYGRNAFKQMHDALYTFNSSQHYLIGYKLKNTLSKNGSVSRGACNLDSNHNLIAIQERTHIYKKDELLVYKNKYGSETTIKENTIVSMNFWGFTPEIFDVAEAEFLSFLNDLGNNITKEFYIATIVDACVNKDLQRFNMLETASVWHGITYQEDAKSVAKAINDLIINNIYPEQLW